MRLVFSTGGIGYHLRAAKYSQDLWDTYRLNLEQWLMSWEQKSTALFLIGPSAGYSLSENFLRRYKKIYVSEPDPLARVLLRKRFPNCDIETVKGDFIKQDLIFPESDILFCNLLGQLRLNQNELKRLLAKLANKNFASYHDLFSFRGNFHWLAQKIHAGRSINEAHLFSLFMTNRKQNHVALTIEDHGLLNFFPSQTRLILHWEIVPGRHHLIECVTSNSFDKT